MAFFFGDGFDLYMQISDVATYWDTTFGNSSLVMAPSGRFAGSRSITQVSNTTGAPHITKTSGVNDVVHHFSLSVMQNVALSGASIGMYVNLYDGANVQCCIGFRSDGAMLLTSAAGGTGTTLATYTGAIAGPNVWYQFEIEVVINNTTGSFTVRKLGNTSNDFQATSLNTRNGSTNAYANKIGIGNNWSTAGNVLIDDFLWRSDASSVAWVGDIRCLTRMPLSDSAAAWARSGSIVPLTPFLQGSNTSVSAGTARYNPFTATCTGTIGSVTVSNNSAYTGNMKCSIFSYTNAQQAGAILGSATPISNPPGLTATFTFPTPVPVAAGTQYFIGFSGDSAWFFNCANAFGSGSYNQSTYQGNTLTYASFPAANPPLTLGGQLANVFTVNITPTTLANADFVSEVAQDTANTYVQTNSVGASDLYNLPAMGSTPTSIVAITTRAYLQKSDAGGRVAAAQLQSGASNVQTPLVLPTSWTWLWRNDLVDPATGAAWLAPGANNAKIGAIVTG